MDKAKNAICVTNQASSPLTFDKLGRGSRRSKKCKRERERGGKKKEGEYMRRMFRQHLLIRRCRRKRALLKY